MRRIFQHKLPLFFISCLFAVVLFNPLFAPVAHADGLGAGCEFGWAGSNFNLTLCAGSISLLIMGGTGYIAGIAGSLMDYTITNLVLDMKKFVVSTDTINNTWRTLRDFSNIFFIFILLYASIATILDINGFQTKQVLVRLVVAALLINFSFFLTSVVIDTSNILALQFHNALKIEKEDGEPGNVSEIFADSLNISSLFDKSVLDNMLEKDKDNIGFTFIIVGIMGTLMLLVLTFVFFAAAILLLVRFGLLLIILILAPLAFMAMILPSTQKFWQMWWKTLLDQSLFAPTFFLMIYLSAVIVSNEDFIGLFSGNPGMSITDAVASGDINNIGVLLSFAIVITFLITSIIIAKKIGGQAGSIGYGWAQKAQKWTQKKVRSGIKTGSSAAVRGTVGQSARFVDDKLRETRFGTSYVGSRILNKTTKKVAGAKFGGKKSAIDTHKASLKDKKERFAKEAENDVNKVKRRERRLARKDQKLQNEVRQQEELVGRQFDTTQEGQELQALSQEVYETQAQHEQRRNEAAENERNNNPLVGEIERLERERGGWENFATNGQNEQLRLDAQRRVAQLQEMIRARRERLEQEVSEAREAAIPPEEIQQLDANITRINQLAQQRSQVRAQASADTRKALQKVQEKLTNQVHAQRVREKWQARATGWRSWINKRTGADTLFHQDMYEKMAKGVEKALPTSVPTGEKGPDGKPVTKPRPAGYVEPVKFREKTREDQLKEIMDEMTKEQGGGSTQGQNQQA